MMTSPRGLLILLLACVVAVTVGDHWPNGMDEQLFNPMEHELCYADVVFVLDSSGSVGKQGNWQLMLDFVKAFAHRMHFGPDVNQIAVVTFGNNAFVNIRLDHHMEHEEFNRTVDQIRFLDERTNTPAALRIVMEQVFTPQGGDRTGFANVILVLTDGKPNLPEPPADADQETFMVAQQLKDMENTYIFAIGIGAEGVEYTGLDRIANSPPDLFVRRVMRFSDLQGILEIMLNNVCEAAEGELCHNKDIAFVLDASGSVGRENFQKMLQFIRNMMKRIPIGMDLNQVGLMTYSTEAFTQSLLNSARDNNEFDRRLDQLQHINQRTNISGAIWKAMTEIFSNQQSFRRLNEDVLVLVSDGEQNTDTLQLLPAAIEARKGARIVTISIGYDSNLLQMQEIASRPSVLHSFVVKDYDELVTMGERSHGDSIYDFVCRETYPEPELLVSTSNCESDLTIILDSSSSLSQDEFRLVTSQWAHEVSTFDLSRRRVCVIMFFDSRAEVAIHFDGYTSAQDLASRIHDLPHVGGSADMSRAFELDVFYGSGSRRANVVQQNMLCTATGVDIEVASRLRQSLDRIMEENSDMTFLFYTMALDTNIDAELLATTYATEPAYHFGFVYREQDFIRPGDVSVYQDLFNAVIERSCIDAAQTLWTCDFDGSSSTDTLCGATNPMIGGLQWRSRNGVTPSRWTGPDSAFTLPNYMYLEATRRQPGDDVSLQIRVSGVAGPVCLYFLRHMNGHHIGSLQVLVADDNGHERIIWLLHGQHNTTMRHQWVPTSAQLMLELGDYVVLRAVRGTGYSSDIAIDSVTLKRGPCELSDRMQNILDQYRL